MFLNDAFDSDFDRQHRSERPICSGHISVRAVWLWGWAWLVLGEINLIWVGKETGALGLALGSAIVLYDGIHKRTALSPVLMGICRFLVYIAAASLGANGITGWAIWCGIALMFYIVGLSYLARRESTDQPFRRWPAFLLAIPILLAFLLNADGYREAALLLSTVVGLWLIRCLRPAFWSFRPDLRQTVSSLLAGIVFVDWLAVADAPRQSGFVFIPLFLLTLLFQRFVPAT